MESDSCTSEPEILVEEDASLVSAPNSLKQLGLNPMKPTGLFFDGTGIRNTFKVRFNHYAHGDGWSEVKDARYWCLADKAVY